MADKRRVQLGRAASTAKDGVFAIVDPITDETVQTAVQQSLGAVRASMDWQSDTSYNAGDFVLFQGLTAWESLTSSNVGNVPTEGTYWTTSVISPADGITDTVWQIGLFTYEQSKIVYQNAQYYLQVSAPFESSDIDAEILAGDWAGPVSVQQEFVDFIPQDPEPAHNEGRVFYDDIKKNYVFMNDRISPRMDVGREQWIRAVNKTGSGTTDGKVVYQNGTVTGDLPNVDLAKADSLTTSKALGLYTENVAIDDNGEVASFGLLNDIDTSSWMPGTVLYLSDSIAGALTDTIPFPPNAVVPIGFVIKQNATTGKIFVNVGHIEQPVNTSVTAGWSAFSGSTAQTNWVKGFYTFESSITPAGGQTMGTANVAYAAHVYFVLGATSTDMIIRINGTRIDDFGVRTTNYNSDIDTSGGVLDDYFETPEKFIGQVTITLLSGTGILVVYGWAAYWDNRNTRFVVSSVEWTGLGGANDAGPNISLYHHKPTGWTYNAAGAILPPPIVDMQSTYITEFQLATGQYFKYKIIGISDIVLGEGSEGIVFGIDITANNAVANSNIEMQKV